jgi:hypothetical protein
MSGLESMEHAFSIELKNKRHVKNISISDEAHDRVLFEGNLGELLSMSLVEGDILELIGFNGVLRISLTREQLQETIKAASQVIPQLRGGELKKYHVKEMKK